MAKSKIPKVTSFNTANVREILSECETALKEIAERHGVVLTQKRCGFRAAEFQLPFGMLIASDAVAGADPRDAKIAGDYTKYATSFGLKPEWLGQSYADPRYKQVKIVGLAPKSRTYPVIVEVEGGKRYKFALDTVMAGMAPSVPQAVPGTKVRWKHEYENGRDGAAGPAWLEDPTRPGVRLRLECVPGIGMCAVEEDPNSIAGTAKDGHLINWVGRSEAKRYAERIGAAYVEV